jgi:hypothetical protein
VTDPVGRYEVAAVTGGGSISGVVEVAAGVTPKLPQVPETLPVGCGPPDRSVDVAGGKLTGAVVWLTDIRKGKGFPVTRRYDIVNANCLISPRVMPIFAGATINVGSDDAVLHHDRFINVATGEVEAIAPFNDKGEIVPFDRLLTKTAEYEIVCDVHPWTHAWLVVLDHPYFSQSAANGAFSIPDVPAGSYHIRAWHPAYGFTDGTVNVTSGGTADVRLVLGAAPAATPDSAVTAVSSSRPAAQE